MSHSSGAVDSTRRAKTFRLRFSDLIEPAYICIARLAAFAEIATVNLVKLVILAPVPRFPAGGPFFVGCPNVKFLAIASGREEPFPDSALPEFLASIPETQLATSQLRTLRLCRQFNFFASSRIKLKLPLRPQERA